jgi:hypothetical protein
MPTREALKTQPAEKRRFFSSVFKAIAIIAAFFKEKKENPKKFT